MWLAQAGERGWIVLMKDDRIRCRPGERAVLDEARVCTFVLAGANLTGAQQAECLVTQAEAIRRFHAEHAGPYVIGIYPEPPFPRKLYPRRRLVRRKAGPIGRRDAGGAQARSTYGLRRLR